MTIKLEVGKLYLTRDGRKAFCSVYSYHRGGHHYACLIAGEDEVWYYTEQGRVIHDAEHAEDIIAEWSEWRPIETAPRDGTAIICAMFAKDVSVEWVNVMKFHNGEWHLKSMGDGHLDVGGYPTHWMPIPKGPEEA